MNRLSIRLLALSVLLVAACLLWPISKDPTFTGSDDQARDAISTINPSYQPWFSLPWEPPSGEISTLLFSLQAALGTGVVAYYIGFRHGQRRARKDGGEHAQS